MRGTHQNDESRSDSELSLVQQPFGDIERRALNASAEAEFVELCLSRGREMAVAFQGSDVIDPEAQLGPRGGGGFGNSRVAVLFLVGRKW